MEEHQGAPPIIPAEDSIVRAADKLVAAARQAMKHAETEEDLRVGFEKALEPLKADLAITSRVQYEKTVPLRGGKTVYRSGRSDAIHGQVIIEYEAPGAFGSPAAVEHAFDQLVDYLRGEAEARKDALFLFDPKLVGVGFDGERVFFVHYRGDKAKAKLGLDRTDFARNGPYTFNQQAARTLLTYLRALSRRLLTAQGLAEVFGPEGNLAREAVGALCDAMENWAGSPRVAVLYREWQRLFGIVYGEHFMGGQAKPAATLAKTYGLEGQADFQKLLFAVHTYFVFLMKLIAAELLYLSEKSFASSFCDDLAHAGQDALIEKLKDIESGGVYARRRITNFLEGDFFRWYLDALSLRLEESVRNIAGALAEFEPGTAEIAPESRRDLLKRLYQYLVPAEVRHNLGEYYTPDWLAELTIDESGYDGDLRRRFLDPACGSGTFLALAIARAREFARENGVQKAFAAEKILRGIWGFDINPLAVLAARTNYLFALGDLVDHVMDLEVPVYLADSVLWQGRTDVAHLEFGVSTARMPTSAGVFHIPSIWVTYAGFSMRKAAPLVEKLVKADYSPDEALAGLRKAGLVFPPHEPEVLEFYREVLALEKKGENGMWARLLKNASAPLVAGKFDYVVGNPPWVRWGYLSREYREATFPLWQEYGLFSLKGHAARLGGGEKDFSMLFTAACIDFYLEKGGKLAFLITQEVLKSKGAGEGFRRFSLGAKGDYKVVKAHDLATVQPFEGAANKTAMIVVEKGKPTKYPVPYHLWTRKKGVGKIPTNLHLPGALPLLKKQRLSARPIGKPTGAWQTLAPNQRALARLKGHNLYTARLGARVEPYGVFWLTVEQVMSDGDLIVRNMHGRGKRTIQAVEERIEKDLVFPAVSGRDIQRWHAAPGMYVLMCQDPQTCQPFPQARMKQDWPRTYGYLTRFRDVLLSRGSKTVRQLAERTEFYAMFGIGPYTVARYRVVWKRMAGDLVAAVISQHRTPFGYKTVIATDTTSLFATAGEGEAHYLCAVVNSKPVRQFLKSFSSAGRGFGAPSVMEPLAIPKFDDGKPLHRELAACSKELHGKKMHALEMECLALERQVDRAVASLFGLK